MTRRQYLMQTAGVVGSALLPTTTEAAKPIRVAVIFTAFTYRTHTHVLLENFLHPYLFRGKLVQPDVQIVSMWGDQFPEGDMSHAAAKEYGIYLAPTIREAMTFGSKEMMVDAVLLIGEQGEYSFNELGQKLYPRKQFFDQIVAVMQETGNIVPLFSDKHFSYRWDWAKQMYDTAKSMHIPMMAGSSVPLAHRRPKLDLPRNTVFEELLLVHCGGWGLGADSYDFHGLEVLQSLVESRKGAETGVSSVQYLEGEAVWKAAAEGLWNPKLVEVALHPELGDQAKQWREFAPDAYLVLIRYRDGLIAPLLAVHGNRWAFSCRVQGQSEPQGCDFEIGPWMNRNLFKALAHAIQHFFRTKKSPYPLERNLLTTGMTEAVMLSRHRKGEIQQTPHLEFSYKPRDVSVFCENGESWKILTNDVPEPSGINPQGGIDIPKKREEIRKLRGSR